MKYLDRSVRDFLIAVVAVLVFACLAATGLALRYRIPEHDQAADIVAHGGAEPTWLGLTEDPLEDLHFYLAVTFASLVLLHVVLHAKWLWTASKGADPKWQTARGVLFLLFAGIVLAIILSPFLIPGK